MYLIARINKLTGAEAQWFVAFSLDVEQVQVTTARNHARRFKLESDAMSALDMAVNIAPEHKWKIVAA